MRYMGGKSRLAKDIGLIINNIANLENINNYYEPFCGGCAVAEVVNIKNRHCSDLNKFMIALLKKLAEEPIWEYKYVTEEEWYDVKANQNTGKYPDWYIAWVGICCSFRGKWFAGYSGEITTQDGKLMNYQEGVYKNIRIEQQLLQGIRFKHCSYKDVHIEPNSIIYCDPPYANTVGYMTGKFEHEQFYSWCIEQSKNKLVIISEYWMPKEFMCIAEIEVSGGIGNGRAEEYKPIERLYAVDGGYLVDKYFSQHDNEYDF